MTEAVAIILAYAIGSVPATWLIHNWRTGDDLRRMGDGNVGSANAIREGSGWFWGHLALLADTGKGLLAISVARWLNLPPVWWMAAGYVVMLGHMYPVWLGFRGGRAAATAMGAAGGFLPWQFGSLLRRDHDLLASAGCGTRDPGGGCAAAVPGPCL